MNKIYIIIIAAGLAAGTTYGADTWLKVASPKPADQQKGLPQKAAQVIKGLLSGLSHSQGELAHLRAEIDQDKQSLSYNIYRRRLFADHKPFKLSDDMPLKKEKCSGKDSNLPSKMYQDLSCGFSVYMLPPSAV